MVPQNNQGGNPSTFRTISLTQADSARFWAKVDKNGSIPSHCPELGPCWLWLGARWKNSGYARFRKRPLDIPAHRVSWQIHFGEIEVGKLACHKCDNRGCTNPSHLFLGTQKENIADADSKGRMKRPTWNGTRVEMRGANGPNTKITEDEARVIKALVTCGFPQLTIAKEMDVSRYIVNQIARGKTWIYL